MADSNMQLQWTDEQWNKVRQVVYEEARKARVAGNFLPLYGPLEPDAAYVNRELLIPPGQENDQGKAVDGFTVADSSAIKLSTLQVKVYLKGAQVSDPELTSALIAFRRAANVVARLEDDIIFSGQPGPGQSPAGIKNIASGTSKTSGSGTSKTSGTSSGEVIGGEATDGLMGPDARRVFRTSTGQTSPTNPRYVVRADQSFPTDGEALVTMISKAIAELEARHHFGPFACVLGHGYFNAVQTPATNSMILPQDRILPFLVGGALLRTSSLPEDAGLVIALSGEPIDLVVATDISVKFLQVTLDPWFVFRVYEKIVLRIKQPDAIAVLHV
jgi:uncharacterized linocin/CFP29 family protein